MVDIEDKLGFQYNYNIKAKIGEEHVYFSDKIKIKLIDSLFGTKKERDIIVTDLAVYNFNDYEIERKIKIENLKAITISTTSDQFILHCNQNEYDCLYLYHNKQKIIKILENAYKAKTNLNLLFCKKHDKDLTKFVVGKKERKKNPYLFKINQNELISIKDYIVSEQKNEPLNPISPPPSPISSENSLTIKVVEGKGRKIPPPPPPPPPPPIVSISKEKQMSSRLNRLENVSTTQYLPSQLSFQSTSNIKVIEGKGKKIPPPPSPPPPPPLIVSTPKKFISSKPVDLAAELVAKKNSLIHVEVKDYVSPILQKMERSEDLNTKNSIMDAIIAKRSQMKKDRGGGKLTGFAEKQVPPRVNRPGEVAETRLTLLISSGDQNILNFAITCEKKDVFNTIVNKLYMQYPKYQEIDCYFMCNGKRIKEYQTIEKNCIKDGDHIIIYEYDVDD